MKPFNVKDSTYVNHGIKKNEKDLKFKNDVHVRTSKYKIIFAKGYTPNWLEEVFVIKQVKNTVSWTYVIEDLVKKLLEHFMKNNYKKQKVKWLQKVKWKDYDNSFNSWIDKKDII